MEAEAQSLAQGGESFQRQVEGQEVGPRQGFGEVAQGVDFYNRGQGCRGTGVQGGFAKEGDVGAGFEGWGDEGQEAGSGVSEGDESQPADVFGKAESVPQGAAQIQGVAGPPGGGDRTGGETGS